MVRLLVFAAAVSLVAVPQQRPAPDVPGASALVESRDVPTLIVRFTNSADVGLRSLEVEVQSATGPMRKSWSSRDASLGTGGTAEMAIGPLGAERALPVRVIFGIFADGTVSGEPAEVARVQAVSIAIADDLSAWRDVLTLVPGLPQEAAVTVLRAAIERRKTEQATDPSGIRRLVETWLREDRPRGFFVSVVKTELSNIEMRMTGAGAVADAARVPPGLRPQRDLIKEVTAVTTTGVTRHFTVSVRNQREVPLESWVVVLSDSETGRPLRVIARDAGNELGRGTAAGIPGAGVLQVGTYQPESDLAGGVRAHLEFAMWQDLTWQGYEINRERTLAGREMLAQEYEFFLPAIRSAAALPAAQAVELLTARQVEFRAGPLGRQSSGLQVHLGEWAHLADTAPKDLPDRLNAHAAMLDAARASLLRHRQK